MKILKQQSGFTLVEALVAISILMIAIASPMTLAQKGLSSATQSKDQMIASFLAQDAIEAVKNIRDQIAVSKEEGDWLDSTVLQPCMCGAYLVGSQCNFDLLNPTYCQIDTTAVNWDNISIKPGTIGYIPVLNTENTTPDILGNKRFLRYTYNTNSNTQPTKFKRYVNIVKTSDTGDGANEAVINVRVFWDSPQGPQKIDIKDFIYNYSENL